MRRQRHLARMLTKGHREAPAALGEASELDFDYGVASLSLDQTIGGFRPLRLRVGGGTLGGEEASFSSPLELASTGEYENDLLDTGFFAYHANNLVVLSYPGNEAEGYDSAILSLSLGGDFEGSVTLAVGSFSETRALSGSFGDGFSLALPSAVIGRGSINLSATQSGIFRLSLCPKKRGDERLSLSIAAADGDGENRSVTRISLPTPMYLLPSGSENSIDLGSKTMRAEVASVDLLPTMPISVASGSETMGAPIFHLTAFSGGRGDGEAYSTHGRVGLDDPDVLGGLSEGLSLLSSERETLAMAVKYQRLISSVGTVNGVRTDGDGVPSPGSPIDYRFFPEGDRSYLAVSSSGGRSLLRLAEPLRAVGDYTDSLLLSPDGRYLVRITRVGVLRLLGRESGISLQHTASGRRLYYPVQVGQAAYPSNNLPQLFSHGDVSSEVALVSQGRTDYMTAYLDRTALSIALAPDADFAASRAALADFLSAEAARGMPLTIYFPLAEPRCDIFSLAPAPDGTANLSPLTFGEVTRRDGDTLTALLRLWILGEAILPRVIYRRPSPEILALLETRGELRLSDGRTMVSTLGEHKPLSIALTAYIYPTRSTSLAAEGEASQMPQKGTS